jgi:hypothetical protein
MARIRSIHPDTFVSSTLAQLTDRQERTWWRLLVACDDAGRALADPRYLRGQMFPLVDRIAPADVAEDIDAMAALDLVQLYVVARKRYLAVRSWVEYQHPNRPTPSRRPGPNDAGAEPLRESLRASLSESSVSTHAPDSRKVGRQEDRKTGEQHNVGQTGSLSPHAEPSPLPALASAGARVDAVGEVFTTWAATRPRPTQTKLTDKRRRLIAVALKQYPLADVLAAVRGWQCSPFHRGENERGQVYSELELVLRDAEHVEKFRDLWLDGPPTPPPVLGPTGRAMLAARRERERRGAQ